MKMYLTENVVVVFICTGQASFETEGSLAFIFI